MCFLVQSKLQSAMKDEVVNMKKPSIALIILVFSLFSLGATTLNNSSIALWFEKPEAMRVGFYSSPDSFTTDLKEVRFQLLESNSQTSVESEKFYVNWDIHGNYSSIALKLILLSSKATDSFDSNDSCLVLSSGVTETEGSHARLNYKANITVDNARIPCKNESGYAILGKIDIDARTYELLNGELAGNAKGSASVSLSLTAPTSESCQAFLAESYIGYIALVLESN